MEASPVSPTWIRIDVPEHLKMGLKTFAELAGWRIRKRSGQLEATTLEQYKKRPPELLTIMSDIFGPDGLDVSAYSTYTNLPTQQHLLSADTAAPLWKEVERLDAMDSFEAAVTKINLIFTIAATEILDQQMHEVFRKFCFTFDESSRLLLVGVSPTLSMRYAGVRALLTAMVAPEELNQNKTEFQGFRSARGLFTAGTYGAWPFLAPALLPLAPWVSGVMSAGAHANAVWLFSRPLAGRTLPKGDLLDSLVTRFGRSSLDEQNPGQRFGDVARDVSPSDQAAFVYWWLDSMNSLLSFATDVTRFADGRGTYDPRVHLAFVLSLEKLFEDLLSTLTLSGRNEADRMRAAYDALDCLDGLRLGSVRDMTTPSKAKRARQRVQSNIDPAAQTMAMPRCDSAVASLQRVIDGFFLPRHVSTQGLENIPHPKGSRSVNWDNAVPDYLRIIRNAAHSFVKEIDPEREPTKLATFVAHDGQLSESLPDLAWLWILKMMADQSELDRRWPRVE